MSYINNITKFIKNPNVIYKKLEMELINKSNGSFMHFYALQHKFCIEIVIITHHN